MTHSLRAVVPRSRRSIITAVVVVIVLLLAAIGGYWWYSDTHDGRTTFTAVFSESIGVYPGSDVRVLGVPVGAVTKITPDGTDVDISMYLDRGVSVTPSTHAVVVAPSLVSDRYIQLTGVWTSGPSLADGATIPLARTATTVEIDQLTNSVVELTHALGPDGANKNGALSDLLKVSAANLKGNGAALKRTIDQLGRASGTLSNSKSDLFKTVGNLATFTTTLEKNDSSVRGLNNSLSAVSRVLANDRQSFAAALQQLSVALGKVKSFIDDNRDLLASNVAKLATITQTLADERAALAQALRTAPLAVQNVISAYDPTYQTLDGRGNLNELTLWPNSTSSTSTSTQTSTSARTSARTSTQPSSAASSSAASSSAASSSAASSAAPSSAAPSSAGTTSQPPNLLPASGTGTSSSGNTGAAGGGR